ncbi:MAG TPA: long-chain-acyl-CoA synthetase [Rhizomicrobium sp.]
MGLFGAVRREYIYITTIVRTLAMMRSLAPGSPRTFVDIIENHARNRPDAIAIYCQDLKLSYRDLDRAANRYARWALSQGVGRGEAVALLMDNRPDYICAWLGLLKAGAIAALINTNLRGAPLAHCISIAGARHAIIGCELAGAYLEAAATLSDPPKPWLQGGNENLDAVLADMSPAPMEAGSRAGITVKDTAFYIYTSGTTGLPKAANISHMRMLFMMFGFVGAMRARASDRVYNALPLYHSTGGICAVGLALVKGGALIIRRKFSVHDFWNDIHKYDATIFQYIGELCRYLLNAPPQAHERDHHIRAITGNGLRPEIWPAFQARFNIPWIVEFYGATEGNVSMLNYDGTVGAIGRVPWYMRGLMPTRVVRFDIEHEMPVRSADGFCSECPPGEAGEAVGKITTEAGHNFEGYTKSADTEKKILRNVFVSNDAWFRTGDLLRTDAHGYFYFVDRIGDTFRWKGENVATSEVAEALGVIEGIKEANVYGVAVPGMEGRAGMAALVVGPGFDAAGLAGKLFGNLAPFARPVFLRLQPELEVTGTFKLRKIELVKEGFDSRALSDPLYWLDPASGSYEKLTGECYDQILAGGVKF